MRTGLGVFGGSMMNSFLAHEILTADAPRRRIRIKVLTIATAATNPKQQAHELIERLSNGQVSAVVGLLEAMLDPVSVALANLPVGNEPVSEEEARDIFEARAAIARGEVVSNEEVLAEFGLTAEDFERMGRGPLGPEPDQPGQ